MRSDVFCAATVGAGADATERAGSRKVRSDVFGAGVVATAGAGVGVTAGAGVGATAGASVGATAGAKVDSPSC